MSLQFVNNLSFDFLPPRSVDVELSDAPLSSDAGLLVFREFDERIGFTARIADALEDLRDPSLTHHTLLSMIRQRLYGILGDYEDQNDHDQLRSDPIFKLLADRLPTDKDLASQPTLSRFENAVSIADLFRLRDVLADDFIASFREAPRRITLDVDAFDDPAHGQQQLIMFHGYYEQYQYLPITFTCAENDMTLLAGLRHGTCAAYLGADDDLTYLVGRMRAVWPDVQISIRGDSGFGVPCMYDACESLGVTYTFGLSMNKRLQAKSSELLASVAKKFEETQTPQREFLRLEYRADTWPAPRCVVIKVEANAEGTNRRAVVTNRSGWHVLPGAVYDEYAERGESENRNKELKREMSGDRLSDHRFMANFFRLYLHVFATNFLVRLRRLVAEPKQSPSEAGLSTQLPAQALDEPDRRGYFNRRRGRDPLGEGFASTWRTRVIKVAAEVVTRSRRVIIRLSSSWPHLDHFFQVAQAVLNMPKSIPASG